MRLPHRKCSFERAEQAWKTGLFRDSDCRASHCLDAKLLYCVTGAV